MPDTANLVLDLVVTKVDLVDEGANSAAFIKMYKRKEQDANMDLEQILAKMAPEHAQIIRDEVAKAKTEVPAETQAALEAAQADATKAKTDFQSTFDELSVMKGKLEEEVAKGKPPAPDFEEVLKSMDPAAAEMMRTMKTKADLAEQALRKAKEEADHAEAVAKAKELSNLPIEEAKLVEVLKSASAEVVEVLKAVNAATKDGSLFEEVGKSTKDGTPSDAKQAWDKMEKKAGEIATELNISKEKAMGEVMKRHPELYKAYLDGGAN